MYSGYHLLRFLNFSRNSEQFVFTVQSKKTKYMHKKKMKIDVKYLLFFGKIVIEKDRNKEKLLYISN